MTMRGRWAAGGEKREEDREQKGASELAVRAAKVLAFDQHSFDNRREEHGF